jgi:O-antigen/teichoic acid export membrane protein
VSELEPGSAAQTVADDPFAIGAAARRVIHGGGLRVIGTVVGLLSGAVSAPLVVRHLGNIQFGRYQVVISILFIANALSEGGLSFVAVRAYTAADTTRRNVLLANLMGMRIVLEVLVAGAVVGFGFLAGYNHVLILGLAFGGLGLVIAAQQAALTVILQGQLRLATLAATEMANQLIVTTLLVILVISGAGLIWFFVIQPIVWLLAFALIAVLVRHDVPRRLAFDPVEWQALARETALLAVAAALGATYYQVTQVAMSLFASAAQTGYYAVAFRIVAVTATIPWVLGGSLLAVLSAVVDDPRRLRYIAVRAFEGSAIIGGWLVVILVIGAQFGITVIGGAHASVAVLRIMGVGAGATFIVSSSGFVLLAQRRHRLLVVSNLLVFLLAIGLSATLIPVLGARGGALSSAALEFVLLAAYTVALRRMGIAPPTLRFLSRLALALGLALAAGAALLSVHPVVGIAAATIVYFPALRLLRVIPSELLDAIPGGRPSWL